MSENLQKYRFATSILPRPDKHKLVLLTGARQTGKTTLVKRLYPGLRYINLDAPENREILREQPTVAWGRDIGNAVIDEAQKEPVVFEKTKYAWDAGDLSFTVLLGSSQILLLKKIRESLAGRVSLYELWPLTMSELRRNLPDEPPAPPLLSSLFGPAKFDRIFEQVPPLLLPEESVSMQKAEKYLLQWGGMPALVSLPKNERWKWLQDYQYTYLERDVADLARLADLSPFRTFQKLTAHRSGGLLNYSELARDATLSVDTAKRYLEYLHLSYQVVLLQPFYRNLTSTLVKTPKIYWLDLGLLRSLTGMREEVSGNLYETMVVAEFLKWIKTVQEDATMYFYRTRSGLELDLLIQTRHGIFGVEIKKRQKVAPKDLRAMREIAKELGEEWLGGMVVYQGNRIEKISGPHLWAVPSWRLFA